MTLGLGGTRPAAADEPTTPTAVGATTNRRRVTAALGALAMAAVAVPFGVVCYAVAVTPGAGPVYLYGDQAVIALATKSASGWHQLLGPYNRYGWHHPGPTYFYLQSVLSPSLAGGQSLFFGSAVINAAAALLCVAVVWRRAGHRAALWTAICVTFLALAVGPSLLRFPWNPYAVVLPMALLAILCAAAATGSALCLLGSLIVGSYLVQTDIGTAPVVAALGLVALVGLAAARTRWRSGPEPKAWPRPAVLALAGVGILVLVLMWVPPLIQQVTGHPGDPGNLRLIWRFFYSFHPGQQVRTALGAVGQIDGQLGSRNIQIGVLQGTHHLALGLSLALAVVVVVVGLVRRHRLGLGLGMASLAGQLVSIYSATKIYGPIYGYLLLWEMALPVVAALGLGLAILGGTGRQPAVVLARRPRMRMAAATGVTIVLAAGAVAASSVLTARAAQLPPVSSDSVPQVAQAWALVSPQLRRSDSSVLVDVGSTDSWRVGAGLAYQLERHGIRPTVPESWAWLFGIDASTGHEPAVVAVFSQVDAPKAPPPGTRYLGVAGDQVVYLGQRPPAP